MTLFRKCTKCKIEIQMRSSYAVALLCTYICDMMDCVSKLYCHGCVSFPLIVFYKFSSEATLFLDLKKIIFIYLGIHL